MGVAGREEGVGIELTVAVVLRLAPDRREAGLLRLFIVLCASGLGFENVGEEADGATPLRNALGAEGLDTRLRSFSESLAGEGVSSMISTHPDVLGSGVVAPLPGVRISALRLWGLGLASLES